MSLHALVFDVDGTLADTEEAHRRAFNAAFIAHELPWRWDPELYRELLHVAGGKERIAFYAASLGLPARETERVERLVPLVHETKTIHLAGVIAAGHIKLRPGVARLIAEARAAGLKLAIASTTSPANVHALIASTLGATAASWFSVIATGDAVRHKKPAPDIYHLALEVLGAPPEACVAFEDSDLGVRAAKAAGLYTVATPTRWTERQDLSAADLVLPSLGDPGHPLDSTSEAAIGGKWLSLTQLARLHVAWRMSRATRRVVS